MQPGSFDDAAELSYLSLGVIVSAVAGEPFWGIGQLGRTSIESASQENYLLTIFIKTSSENSYNNKYRSEITITFSFKNIFF